MQTLDNFASDYASEIDFYVVSFNEDAAVIQEYITENGYQGFISAQPVGTMLADLEVSQQSAMMALNARGLILHRQSKGDAREWPGYLDQLIENPNAAPSQENAEQQREQRQRDIQLPS